MGSKLKEDRVPLDDEESQSSSLDRVQEEEEEEETEDISVTRNENEPQYKLYKTRWLILIFSIGSDVVVKSRAWRFPIIGIVYSHLGTTAIEVNAWTSLPLVINLITVIPFGRFLDRHGIRAMAYTFGPMMIASTCLQGLILMDETNSHLWLPKEYRFPAFLVSNVLVILYIAGYVGLGPKLANDWFPPKDSTFVLVFPGIVGSVVEILITVLTPELIKTDDALKFIGYLNYGIASAFALIIITCVTRSRPPTPPSSNVFVASDVQLTPICDYKYLLVEPNFVLVLLCFSFNTMALIFLDGLATLTLNGNGYSNTFSGIMSGLSTGSICLGGLLAIWLDRKYDYIWVARWATLTLAVSFVLVHLCQLRAGLHAVILGSVIILGLARGIAAPLLLQAMLRPSKELMPAASVASLTSAGCVLVYLFLTLILWFTEKLSPASNPYMGLYISFAGLTILLNYTFAFYFRTPRFVINRLVDEDQQALPT